MRRFAGVVATMLLLGVAEQAATGAPMAKSASAAARKRGEPTDDSLSLQPARDLALRLPGEHAADALAHFFQGLDLEEQGEMEKALEAYRQVLNLDPGQVMLALRVAELLSRDDDYPAAIDVLKDAAKARPNAPEPYLQLALIYAKYLRRVNEAYDLANKAIALDPSDIDGYQRLFEIAMGAGDAGRAGSALERAARVQSQDAQFWVRLGRLYSALYLKPDATPSPAEMDRLNEVYQKAAGYGQNDAAVLRETADFFSATQQIPEAVPLYVRVLELQPDDTRVREKLATAFVLTNQRARAMSTLETIIQNHPEKYQPYELLAQLHDDEARSLARDNHDEQAIAEWKKAAQNYEQALLINPNRPATSLRLAELLLAPLKEQERAVALLQDARRRFPDAPEFAYYLALALREAKRPKEAVVAFEEALNEAQNTELLKARFYLDYGAAAEQSGLYDKAAELFRKAIAIDPPNAAEAYNYLGYMWAEQNSHLDEAEDAVKRALRLDPSNGAYLDSLGWVQYRQGKYEQALESLRAAIRNLPKEDPVLFTHLGDTLARLNQVPQALEAWQKAKSLDPENKDLAEKIESHRTRVSKTEASPLRP